MTEHHIQLPDLASPLTAPGSGATPVHDDILREQNGRFRHIVDMPAFTFDGPSYLAQLAQVEPGSGRRGWYVTVCQGDRASLWPCRMISRPGLRPPTLAARLDALAKLGFEPEHTGDDWSWKESKSLDRRHVLLQADLVVRAIPPAAADVAAAVDVPQGATA